MQAAAHQLAVHIRALDDDHLNDLLVELPPVQFTALLDARADINARESEWDQTPLIFAASLDREEAQARAAECHEHQAEAG